jgi:hypothetical protein
MGSRDGARDATVEKDGIQEAAAWLVIVVPGLHSSGGGKIFGTKEHGLRS